LTAAMTSEPVSRPLVGVVWMVVTGLCFIFVTAIVKHVGKSLPSSEAVFLRYGLGLVFLLPMLPAMARTGLDRRLATGFALRGVPHALATLLWFFAMTQIPMAEVTAMNYLSPVYVTLGAALFLGERLAARRILAIAAALVGALIILRPGFRAVDMGHLAMLGSAPMFAVSYLMAKRLTELSSPAVVVGWLSVTTTVALVPFALAVWVPPSLGQMAWLLLTAAFATTAHYTMMLAFRAAPMTVTQPVTFLQLVWSSLLGATLFGEPVDNFVILGGAVILGSVFFITWREAVLKRRELTPAVVARP
jgi:drug/metabolite transporter (DMT)-like permease